jgi:hypothetical protein
MIMIGDDDYDDYDDDGDDDYDDDGYDDDDNDDVYLIYNLTLICGTETYKRSKFTKDISLICAYFYGCVIMKSRGPIPVQP